MVEDKIQAPNLDVDVSGKFKEETINIPILINKEEKVVVLRKITAGERGKIRSDCTKTRILGNQPHIDINDAELEARILHSGIKDAPFPHDLVAIKLLPSNVFDYLMSELNEWAGTSDKKKE